MVQKPQGQWRGTRQWFQWLAMDFKQALKEARTGKEWGTVRNSKIDGWMGPWDPSTRFHTILSKPWSLFCILFRPCQKTVLPYSPEASLAVSSFRFPSLYLQTFSLSPACQDSLWAQQARDLSPWKELPLHLAPYLVHLIFSLLSWFLPSCLQITTHLPTWTRIFSRTSVLCSWTPRKGPQPWPSSPSECWASMLWTDVGVHPRPICWNSHPQGERFGGGLWEWGGLMRLWGWGPPGGIHGRGDNPDLCLPPEDTERRWPWQRVSLTLDSPASRTVREKILWLKFPWSH